MEAKLPYLQPSLPLNFYFHLRHLSLLRYCSFPYCLITSSLSDYRCWSFVGKKGGQQVLSLQAPDSISKRCFYSLGKPIHELLHALGMFHEQARPDRDDHIEIITDNIIPRECMHFLCSFHSYAMLSPDGQLSTVCLQ